jgi:signal transduction histidine kinase
MNGILGMTELALNTPLTSQQQNYLKTIKQSGDALLTLLNDVLDLSKVEAGRNTALWRVAAGSYNIERQADSGGR